MEVYFAKFEYSTPKLIKVEVTKETPKRYQYNHKDAIILLGKWYHFSGYIDKDDSVFGTQQEAIDWLVTATMQRLESTRKEVTRLEDSLNELDKMLEGLNK